MPLQIIRDDITHITADAVVNTANPLPVIGAGTDTAIHAAAGAQLLAARKEIGEIAPGHCAATPAFGLRAKYVLHTVCPVWEGGMHREAGTLRQAYDAALKLAAELSCDSVAFPLMAAGSYGFPQDVALSVAIQAITDFLMEHELTVLLVLYNGSAFRLAASLFDGLKAYIDDHYVAEHQPVASSSRLSYREKRNSPRFEACVRPEAVEDRVPNAFHGAASASGAMADSACVPPAASLSELLAQEAPSFSEYLLSLLQERDGKDSEVYKRAEISRQLFSKILSTKDYQPTKSTAIQLAIGLQLDLNQTIRLLEKAGYTLTRSSKTDLVVQYYIERKVYSVTFINEALSDCGLPLLKTGLKV